MREKRFRAFAIAIGLCIILAYPALVSAQKTDCVNIRPIEDWAVNNNDVGYFFDMDPEVLLATYPHATLFNAWGFDHPSIWECDYHGYIKEKVLDDGSLDITVNLHVKGAYLPVRFVWDFPNPNYPITIIDGYIDYYARINFVLEPTYPGGSGVIPVAMFGFPYSIEAGSRAPGAELPWYWHILMIPEVVGAELKSFHFVGNGFGEFTDFAEWAYGSIFGFTSGQQVKVKVGQTVDIFYENVPPVMAFPLTSIEGHVVG